MIKTVRITALIENTCENPELKAEHGLSFYIETGSHKILFDLGPNGLFLENAAKLGIDIKSVDTVIISHGHYDHGGALRQFISVNSKAKIYIKSEAFENYYNSDRYIGLDKSLKGYKNFVFTGKSFDIDEGISLFSGITERTLFSSANDNLFAEEDGKKIKDGFSHEQYLILTENDRQLIFTGCAHNGIVNILNKFDSLYKNSDNIAVFGGFHLYLKSLDRYESDENIIAIAKRLNQTGYDFYTCHCTGEKAFFKMKEVLKDRLLYFSTGETVEI